MGTKDIVEMRTTADRRPHATPLPPRHALRWLACLLLWAFAAVQTPARQCEQGGAWQSFGVLRDLSDVYALAVLPNGDVIAGGSFTTAGGVTVNRIARWNATTSTWSAMGPAGNPGVDGPVYALAVLPNGDVIAGGSFTTAGGVTVNRIARWNATTSTWSAMGPAGNPGVDGPVYALAVLPNGDLIAGGFFTTAGGVTVNRIARWNATTSTWSAMGPSGNPGVGVPTSSVSALAVLPNGDLIAGGNFATAGNVTVNGIARWNATTSTWSAMGPSGNPGVGGTYRWVRALAVLPNGSNGDLIAGGSSPPPAASPSTASPAGTPRLQHGRRWARLGIRAWTAPSTPSPCSPTGT